ncbi:MAG TPA: endo alpha-1,4 polygalactosaminidase [Pilimelia sp.]|nr:endo alpha-1,4 polygalactosaminidase [Pilimelia sp.]
MTRARALLGGLLCALGVAAVAGCAAERAAPQWWTPRPGLTWQWQLTGPLDLGVDADVYELDAFDTPAAAVARLHAAGRRAICYLSAGAYEDFRPDAARFPAAVLGRPNGWAGERWLDVRQWQVLAPVLRDRLRLCRQKGFDAVEADNVDGYANVTGFPLTAGDQLRFNRRVAALAHSLGLAVGLKNDLDQAAALAPDFDFAVVEECFRYAECGKLAPFTAARKPVFAAEYDLPPGAFCGPARRWGFAAMRKRATLDAWRQHC